MRVAALKRLFERKAGSLRRFRHEIYKTIATHAKDAWNLGVTGESDEKSRVKLLGTGQSSNIRDTDPFLVAWEKAIAEAFDGLKLEKVRGSKVPARPNGYWTTELTCR